MSDEKRRILDYRSNPIHVPDVFAGLERIETGILKDPPCQVIPPHVPFKEDDKEASCATYLVFIYLLVFILIIVLNISKKHEHQHSLHPPKA